jgi:glutamate formiminotransferase
VLANQDGFKLNGTHKFLVCANANLLGKDMNATKKITEASLIASKTVGPEVNKPTKI